MLVLLFLRLKQLIISEQENGSFGRAGAIPESSLGGAEVGNPRLYIELQKGNRCFGRGGEILESSRGGARAGNHRLRMGYYYYSLLKCV